MTLVSHKRSTIIARLHAFEDYLASLGLRRGPDRLRQLIKRVELCEEARQKGELELPQQCSDVEQLIWSWVEGIEFARIYEGVKKYDPAVIKKLARKALRGPLLPSMEAPHNSSNAARNTTFELRLGAGLLAQGATVTLGDQADLVVDHEGMRLFIECKRPLHPHGIRRNIEEARHQLTKRLNDDRHPLSAGLVAISVSKAVNPGSQLFRADDADAVLRNLSNDIESLHRRYSPDPSRPVDPRLIGILYHLFTPAYVESAQLLTAAAQTVIISSGSGVQSTFPAFGGQALKSLLNDALQS